MRDLVCWYCSAPQSSSRKPCSGCGSNEWKEAPLSKEEKAKQEAKLVSDAKFAASELERAAKQAEVLKDRAIENAKWDFSDYLVNGMWACVGVFVLWCCWAGYRGWNDDDRSMREQRLSHGYESQADIQNHPDEVREARARRALVEARAEAQREQARAVAKREWERQHPPTPRIPE